MSQNHFTLSFPLKSPADTKAIAQQLPTLMPDFFKAQDTVGTIHYSRFTVLSDKTLLFLGDFDGEFAQLMSDLARLAGTVFDAIFQHVESPHPLQWLPTLRRSSNGQRLIFLPPSISTPLTPKSRPRK